MNKSKIEWCDSTWNPVTGCLHGCEYCYARRIANRFGGYDPEASNGAWNTIQYEKGGPRLAVLNGMQVRTQKDGKVVPAHFPFHFTPTLHRYRMDEPQHVEKPQNVFVCSMADLFGSWVPDEWIEAVLHACKAAPWHTYLFLTKNPARYLELAQAGKLPEDSNFWYGSTTTTPETLFWWSGYHNTFVSIEPMLEPFLPVDENDDYPVKKVGWVIIGAESGNRKDKVTPKAEWIEDLVQVARQVKVPVFMKDSLIPIVGEENMIREFPWEKGGPGI